MARDASRVAEGLHSGTRAEDAAHNIQALRMPVTDDVIACATRDTLWRSLLDIVCSPPPNWDVGKSYP